MFLRTLAGKIPLLRAIQKVLREKETFNESLEKAGVLLEEAAVLQDGALSANAVASLQRLELIYLESIARKEYCYREFPAGQAEALSTSINASSFASTMSRLINLLTPPVSKARSASYSQPYRKKDSEELRAKREKDKWGEPMWILKIVDMKKNSNNHKRMEEFYNHSGIDDQELQLLSENVKTLSTQVASMEKTISNPDFVRKILDQQNEADNKAIMVNMRNAANSIHLICPAPRVTIPKEDLDPLRDFNANYSKITHRPLFCDRPRKWLWFLALFVLVLEVAFGTFLVYERLWSPYGWGIRAHEAAITLGILQQKDAFWSTVESIRAGNNKKQAQGRVLDWEKKNREHGKTKVPE